MDAINNQISNSTSLFKPIPPSKLQQNLSQFYQQTSNFVNQEFKELVSLGDSEKIKSSRLIAESSDEDESPRLNPIGLGQLIDIHI